jgi:hypothetical protein
MGFSMIMAIALLLESGSAWAMNGHGEGPHPYGGYCRGPRWGWYGAKTPVRTERDARERLEKYFEGQDVVIGEISQRGMHFHAEIRDHGDTVVDRVIIDRRTGRIRSLY